MLATDSNITGKWAPFCLSPRIQSDLCAIFECCSSRTSGSVIPEENPDEFWPASDIPDIDVNQVCGSSGSLSLPIQQNQSTSTVDTVDINSRKTNSLRRGGSPAPMYNSSYDNSPGRDHGNTNGYMLMSPGMDINRRYVFIASHFDLRFCD